MKNEPNTDTLWKTYLVYFLMLFFGIMIVAKVIIVMTKDKKKYTELAEKREYRVRDLEASRGNILSCDGNLMATSVPVYDIFLDAKVIDNDTFSCKIDSLSAKMARMFPNKNAAKWKADLCQAKAEEKRYYPVIKNVSLEQYRAMQQFPIFNKGPFAGGMVAEKKVKRVRPYNELAGRLIGYVNENENLYVGLEGAYNSYLRGVNGQQLVRRLHHGDWMPIESEKNSDPENGNDLFTTFDVNLQDIVESSLHNTMVENKAEQGCAILMETSTGYIRAVANLKLNHKSNEYEESYNFALAERYEPGSVFKIASMVVLFNHKPELALTDKVNIGMGPIVFSKRTMRDDHSFAKNGIATVAEVIEQSSNKGTAVLITKQFMTHPEKYVDGLYALGLNKKIETGIAGEAQPLIKHPFDKDSKGNKLWSNVSLPWMSIGYEVNVTPMQILTLYNAIANQGKMMKPQFVTEIRRGNQTIKTFEPEVMNEQICPPECIKKLQEMLHGVTVRGTAKRQFADCSFPVAGKTGTAQYCDPVKGYNYREPGIGRHLYNTTFVGYFPADNPKYTCIVVVSRARGRFWAAGGVSAPCFRDIAEKVYATRLGVEQDTIGKKTELEENTAAIVHIKETSKYLSSLNINCPDYTINGEWAVAEKVNEGKTNLRVADIKEGRVPNVIGMNITDAVYLLESMGINTKFSGQGIVTQQSIQPGDTIKANSVIQLKLEKK